MSMKVLDGPTAWKCLNGVINVYKPAGIRTRHIRDAILGNLCKDLNSLDVRMPMQRIAIEPGGNHNYLVHREEKLADHVLAVGPRYQLKDFKFGVAAGLGVNTSGVLVVGINNGLRTTTKIQLNRPLRVYHVTGTLGKSTESFFENSRITWSAPFKHVRRDRLDATVASLQASHQQGMHEMYGVDLQSQAAYDEACKGFIHPADNSVSLVFGIRLIHFALPEFTLEIQTINESENFLAAFVNEIAIKQRTVAFCSKLRCIRHGHFSVENSLLRRHWSLDGVLQNMVECEKIIEEHPKMLRRIDPALTTDYQINLIDD